MHGVAINPASFPGRGVNAGRGRRGTPGDNHRKRRPRDIAEQVKSLRTLVLRRRRAEQWDCTYFILT